MAFNNNQLNTAPSSNSALMQRPVLPREALSSPVHLQPPKPVLQASLDSSGGVQLMWNMDLLNYHAAIGCYQIYFCMGSDTSSRRTSVWRRLGDVPTLPLPMTCTLARFVHNQRYGFIIRATDVFGRPGESSDPVNFLYTNQGLLQ